jgi:hypothetical protein
MSVWAGVSEAAPEVEGGGMAAFAVAAKGLGCEMGLFFVHGDEVMRALAMNKSRSRTP